MNAPTTVILPISDYRQQILHSIDLNQVTIITAETGAGKSTQVPQYLLEHGYRKVIVTQPRILAARNLSARVREEWLQRHQADAPTVVGYRTAHERDDNEETAILYCTDGLQLVREVTGAGTGRQQVLVLDEIHEWNQNMEVLVAWAKKRCQEDDHFKVVVMSATIDADSLAAYFGAGRPILVPGRNHTILMRRSEDLVEEIVRHLEKRAQNILVFLPGKSEIESVASRISEVAEAEGVPVIPLHSQLEADVQQLAFESYPHGKVILSTNIAQTSITIDDIDVVIDSGLERTSEIQNGVEGLVIAQVSRADCLQRAGRAGRTKKGEYVLTPYDRMPCEALKNRPAYAIPEIMRTHLDRLVLRLANVGIDIEELEFFHAPTLEAIQDAKRILKNLGAMTSEGVVTSIGKRMEKFPVESRYARMLVEAEYSSDTLRQTLSMIIAIQEVGGIVKNGSRFLGWMRFTSNRRSDLLAQYDVYLALPAIDPETFEELGIVSKSVDKAAEVQQRLSYELGLGAFELESILELEEVELMRCIVAGQIDQVWVVGDGAGVNHVSGGRKRELSGGTVLYQAGIITGTPFNLEVSTPRGLETLYFVQGVTLVNPEWLEAFAPSFFKVQAGKAYFDAAWGSVARRWLVMFKGTVVKGIRTPLTEPTPQNRRLFSELYGAWLHSSLERERLRLQKESGKRITEMPLYRLQENVRALIGRAVMLGQLNAKQRIALGKLAHIQVDSDTKKTASFPKKRHQGRVKRQRR